jgi:hypothetical protein
LPSASSGRAIAAAGLRAISPDGAPPDGFRIGVPLMSEIERAVTESRYTVAVLSTAYVASGFAELGDVMAQHLGVEQAQRRLLPVLREPVVARLGLRTLTPPDLTDPDPARRHA